MWGGGDCNALWMQLLVHFRKEKERKGSNPVTSKMSHTERYQSSQTEFRAFCNVCKQPHLTGLGAEGSSWLLIGLVWGWDFSPVCLLLGGGGCLVSPFFFLRFMVKA